MKRLLLVRHGPAAGKAPGGTDRDRPLTPEGRRAVEAIALRLKAVGATADLALCSTARRARETLDILLAERPLPEVELEDALYLADAKSLQRRLRELPT
ncbi:MAG: SixA phosphatase family protein, partial [Acidobacteriota bacterium]